MGFSGDLNRFARTFGKVLRRAPWLPLAAIAGEAVQHAVEVRFGMYVRGDGIQAGPETNFRMAAAAIKVVGFVATLALTARACGTLGTTDRPSVAPIRRSTAALAILVPIGCHYVLNYRAVGKSPPMVIGMVAVDTLVVGWLAITIAIALPRSRARTRGVEGR